MIERIASIDSENDAELEWLGQSFYSEGGLPGEFILECFKDSWRKLMQNDIGAMWKLMKDGRICGGIGGICYPAINDGELVAEEAFWYVGKEHRGGLGGLRLVKEFEIWAVGRGAKRINMAYILASMPESVRKFYENHGYKLMEMRYTKDLWQ